MYAYMSCHSEIDMLIWSVCIFLIHVWPSHVTLADNKIMSP